tara:strand:- start:18753 stop:19418 length:666 start_codon:yes stop_codon:yes gene_type:complete
VTRQPQIDKAELSKFYKQMLQAYKINHWWPADSVLEVAVGAILTQNTMWKNVEKAIKNLKSARALTFQRLISLPETQLAELIHPSGYYNIKAKRIKSLLIFLENTGGFQKLRKMDLQTARNSLLSINGIGPETADDILLYGLNLPVFVIDSYTRRILERIDLIEGNESYEQLRSMLESALPKEANIYKKYHSVFVEHAKQVCKKKPICEACCLKLDCPGFS